MKLAKPTDTLARSLNAGRREASVAPRRSLGSEGADLTPDQHLDYLGSVLGQQLSVPQGGRVHTI